MKNEKPDGGPAVAYSAAEVAVKLKVSRKTVYRLCQRGLLKRSSALRTLVIPRWSLEDFLRNTAE